jgi:hypothetical protein
MGVIAGGLMFITSYLEKDKLEDFSRLRIEAYE